MTFSVVFSNIALSILGFCTFWLFTCTLIASALPPPPELRNKRIVLLIGHPDDEAMFFGPSVLALTRPKYGNHVKIICLSTGNAKGEGEIRKGELLNSARRLGVARREDVHIVDDQRFQDGPDTDWKKEAIADLLAQEMLEIFPHKSSSSEHTSRRQNQSKDNAIVAGTVPQVFLTFDPHGISSHPNHCACYTGATHFLRHHLPRLDRLIPEDDTLKVTLYTLTTHSTLRKYTHVFDALVSGVPMMISAVVSSLTNGKGRDRRLDRSAKVVFVSGIRDYVRGFGAMVYAHQTQMLWFRWGWVLAGRYMVVNDLKRECVTPLVGQYKASMEGR